MYRKKVIYHSHLKNMIQNWLFPQWLKKIVSSERMEFPIVLANTETNMEDVADIKLLLF